MPEEELKAILTESRKNNTANNISGMLLYYEGTFIQLIEGSKEAVEETYYRIGADRRHKNLIKLIVGESEYKNFPDWSMGFAVGDKKLFSQLEGYANPYDEYFLNTNEQSPAITVLKTFAENNRISGY